MIGFGYARSKNILPEYLDFNYEFPIYLILFLIGINLILKLKDPAILIVISMACLIYTERDLNNKPALYAVGLFLASVAVGGSWYK